MKFKQLLLICLYSSFMVSNCQVPLKSIDYFGQTPPGGAASVFAPHFISHNNNFVQSGSFSPDGKEFYFTVTNGRWDEFAIKCTKIQNGQWTNPINSNFIADKENMEAFVSPDGKRLFFNSGTITNTDIWYTTKDGNCWGVPVLLPEPVNTAAYEWFPSISLKNTLALSRGGDIYFFPERNGKFDIAYNIGLPINTTQYEEADPFISPDEDYLIFHSNGRPGGYGQGDLYISYKKKNGKWTNPKNLGPQINTSHFEFSPSVTPDGKYLLFSRREAWITSIPSKIYWISADFIDSLRNTNFVPYVKNPIPDMTIEAGKKFNYTVPDSCFIDDDGNNTLSFLSFSDGAAPLPGWLAFDAASKTFQGIPPEQREIKITVIARDTNKAETFCTFLLRIK